MNDQQQLKALMKETFDSVSSGYDNKALRFFPASAGHMAASLGLRGDEQVLDVACGTGHASFAIAKQLKTGRVTAVDFSPGMLAQARKKAAELKVSNVEFLERDMQNLEFGPASFDVAVCAFGLFFVENMEAQLSHLVSAVRPGGRIMISSFQESYLHPLKNLFFERLETFGVPQPPQTWKRISNEAGCRQLFEKAGLTDIVWNAGYRRMVARLSAKDQGRFRQEHLREVEALSTGKGIWLDVGVLFTIGTKPMERNEGRVKKPR